MVQAAALRDFLTPISRIRRPICIYCFCAPGLCAELDDTKADAYKRRGQARVACHKLRDGVRDLTRAAELGGTALKKDFDLFQQRGLAYFRLAEFSRALADFRMALSLEPRAKTVWNLVGLTHHTLGEFREAIECFDKVVLLETNSTEALFNAACSCQEAGLVDNALQLFSKSLSAALDPHVQTDVLTHRGWLHLKMGSLSLAIADFDQCMRLPGVHTAARYGLALACQATGAFRHELVECRF